MLVLWNCGHSVADYPPRQATSATSYGADVVSITARASGFEPCRVGAPELRVRGRLCRMDQIFHWIIVLAIIAILFGDRKFSDIFRNFGGGGRGGGPHPLPATGAVESSRGSANPKESRPIGSDKSP